jgi:hypothetical protein
MWHFDFFIEKIVNKSGIFFRKQFTYDFNTFLNSARVRVLLTFVKKFYLKILYEIAYE